MAWHHSDIWMYHFLSKIYNKTFTDQYLLALNTNQSINQ